MRGMMIQTPQLSSAEVEVVSKAALELRQEFQGTDSVFFHNKIVYPLTHARPDVNSLGATQNELSFAFYAAKRLAGKCGADCPAAARFLERVAEACRSEMMREK
jgi:hypothetical protein